MLPLKCKIIAQELKPLNSVCFNAQGDYCLTGGQDRTIRLWNPFTGYLIQQFQGHGWEVYDVMM